MEIMMKEILSTPQKYRICKNCGLVNSKDNTHCWFCNFTAKWNFREFITADFTRLSQLDKKSKHIV